MDCLQTAEARHSKFETGFTIFIITALCSNRSNKPLKMFFTSAFNNACTDDSLLVVVIVTHKNLLQNLDASTMAGHVDGDRAVHLLVINSYMSLLHIL